MSDDPVRVLPEDEHNRTLVGHVHPPDWTNPTAEGVYDMVVVGAGAVVDVVELGADSSVDEVVGSVPVASLPDPQATVTPKPKATRSTRRRERAVIPMARTSPSRRLRSARR